MKKNPFSPAKAARTIVWIAIAAAVAVVTISRGVDISALTPADVTLSAAALTLLAFGKVAIGWLRKCVPEDQRTGLLSLLNLFAVPLVFAIAFAGCISVPWSENPLKSVDRISITEKPDGTFKLIIKGDGDGVFSRDFSYSGEGDQPWLMTVAATSELTSPALTDAVDVLGRAVDQVPAILAAIGPAPDSPLERQDWAERLFSFLNANPSIITQLLAALVGI